MDRADVDRQNVISLTDYRRIGSTDNERPPPSPRPAAARPCILLPPIDAIGLNHPVARSLVAA